MADQFQQQTIAATTTDWSTNLPFAQFNPSLGSLQGISVWLDGQVTGNVSIENLQAAPASVVVTLFGTVYLGGPGYADLLSTEQDASASVNLGAYDGDTDYAANSGTVVALSSGSDNLVTLGGGAPGFVGAGTVTLPVSAQTSLSETGPANLLLESGAAAGAAVSLDYDYVPAFDAADDYTYGAGGVVTLADSDFDITPSGSLDVANSVQTPVQVFNFADSTAGWSNNVVAQQFDPSLGTLEAVNLTVSVDLRASVAAENLDSSASTVSTTQTVDVTLTIPASGTAAAYTTVLPASADVSDTMNLGGYDGTTDFGGTSGRIDQGLTQIGSAASSLTGSAMAAFLGLGTVDLPIAAFGSSTADGPANLLLSLLADAGATVTLSYTYLPTESIWATPDVAITQGGTYSVENAQTVQSLVLNAPGATVVLNAPLDVTGGFTLEAGTLVFDGGTLSVGSYLQDGGVVTGGNIDITAAGGITENAGSIVTNGTVNLTAGTTMTLGTLIANSVSIETPGGTIVPVGEPVVPASVITLEGLGTLVPDGVSPSTGDDVFTVVTDGYTAPPGVVADDSGSGPPEVSAGGAAGYQAGGTPVTLDAGLTVSDAEAINLSSATIAISAGFLPGDVLSVGTAEAGIISSYNAAAGVLTLAGPASVADYQAELESVAYAFSAGIPTAGGTDFSRTISWVVSDGSAASTASTSSLSVTANVSSTAGSSATPGDFTGAGLSDILFEDAASGASGYVAFPAGSNQGTWVGFAVNTAYSVVAIGDFTGGGSAEILYRDNANGEEGYLVPATNSTAASWVQLPDTSSAYTVVGAGDFTGNGQDSVLFEDLSTGDMGYFTLGNSGPNTWQDLGTQSLLYSVVGIGDFTGNGTADIMLRDNATGQDGYYSMPPGGGQATWAALGTSSTDYSVVGIGNFSGGPVAQIIFRDNATGDFGYMTPANGSNAATWTDIGLSSTAYTVVQVGDFTASGLSDILFRDNATGDEGYWARPSGAGQATWTDLGTSSTAYSIVASPTYGAPTYCVP